MRPKTVFIALAGVLIAAPAAGQPYGVRAFGPRHSAGPRTSEVLDLAEHALRDRERLDLTEDQVARLDALRQSELERVAMLEREAHELMSRMRAGLADRDSTRARLREREEAEAGLEEAREQLDGILTDDQREELSHRRGSWRGGFMRPRGWYGRPHVAPFRWHGGGRNGWSGPPHFGGWWHGWI